MAIVNDEIVYKYTDDFGDELAINTFDIDGDACIFIEINNYEDDENMCVEIDSPRQLERLISALQGAKEAIE